MLDRGEELVRLPDRLRRLLEGRGPDAELLDAAADAGLRFSSDGPVPALCGSSAHRGEPTPAEITGWKVGPALIASSNGGPRNPRAAYCLHCAALAYLGEAFMPDAELTAEVQAELARLIHRPFQET